MGCAIYPQWKNRASLGGVFEEEDESRGVRRGTLVRGGAGAPLYRNPGGPPVRTLILILSLIVLAGAQLSPGANAATPAAPSDTVLFLVAEKDPIHGDSYVLPLGDPEDIADARALINLGSASGVGAIVTAKIERGSDGHNRDLRNAGQPLWSWHVSQFQGFADAAIEVCDGWPGKVEEDVDAWIANTEGSICFWSYTLVAELGPLPVERRTWGLLKSLYGSR